MAPLVESAERWSRQDGREAVPPNLARDGGRDRGPLLRVDLGGGTRMLVSEASKEVISVVEVLRMSPPAEGKVLLRNVSWETYEHLILDREERRVPRFFYDRGVMEIVSPSKKHETVSRVVASLVDVVTEALDVDVESVGSTTFRREGLSRGFEPDESFYFAQNARGVRGKANLYLDAGDPAPDLIFEADLTSPSLDKLPIYAALGVREVWRYIGAAADSAGRMEILQLRGGEEPRYEAAPRSTVLPPLTSGVLASLVQEGLVKERPAWIRRVREWARGAAE